MKRIAAVLIFFICFLCGRSQKIQTIVPKQVVAGNAFQIQYIIDDPSFLSAINPPQFDNFQLVSGPNYYKGNSSINGRIQPIENIAYTLVPLKIGMIKINPLTAKFKDANEENSDEVIINVVPQPKASFNSVSTYTDINLYAPSSKADLDKLIEDNLFIKAEVDKRTCFLGEAITATFKLYSRLQSISEVINAPSLYGFSVMDMLDINEAHQAVETINGKIFNTSILRKLQLYPAQTGKLTIDEMQLQNAIEFDDSATGKKFKVEKLLASNPIDIVVKPLPQKQPPGYSGAVGQFTISAELPSSRITANTQGKLIITIIGKGNFIQFGTPSINWPKEFEVFDPVVSDELNKNIAPTEGSRKYVFSFTTDHVGSFSIPPVSFPFFDPSSKNFKEAKTDSLKFEIAPAFESKKSINKKGEAQSKTKPLIYFFVIVVLLALAFILFRLKKKQNQVPSASTGKPNYIERLNELSSRHLPGKQFCFEVQKLLSEVNKTHNLPEEQKGEWQSIQNDCQLLIYSDVSSQDKIEELQKRTEAFLKQLQS